MFAPTVEPAGEEPADSPVPTRRVVMAAAGRTVEVEAPDSLADVVLVARSLWAEIDDAGVVKGYDTAVGFHTSLPAVEPPYPPDFPGKSTQRPPRRV